MAKIKIDTWFEGCPMTWQNMVDHLVDTYTGNDWSTHGPDIIKEYLKTFNAYYNDEFLIFDSEEDKLAFILRWS